MSDRPERRLTAGNIVTFLRLFLTVVRCKVQLGRITDLHDLLSGLDAWTARNPVRSELNVVRAVRTTGWSLRAIRSPDRSCVLRSLAIYCEIRRHGQPAEFVSGVRRNERADSQGGGPQPSQGPLDGHAWISSPVLPLWMTGDVESAERFAVGFRYTNADQSPLKPDEAEIRRPLTR